MINATMMTVNPFGENMYILWDETTRDAVVVDPGMMRDAEREMVTNFIEGQQLNVKHILLTHLHLDHVTGARWLADKTGAEVCGSPLDAPLGLELKRQVEEFHLKVECEPLTLDRELNDGDTIPLGDETIQVLHLPGHSPGGLAFYLPQSALLISGDTIFNGSVGRTDLMGGDMAQLINSIREKILPLPDETVIASGHGPTTTVADEKRCNPFL
ncbi:MAG: MBL fold metallo-hydrolase [Muribaculaceae bacterium]|nr:MBL fold metallo-hydrolase [Muribaculaceae bacterium]